MTHTAYDDLARHWSRLHRFAHLSAIASWDRAAMMPAKGSEARAQALAENGRAAAPPAHRAATRRYARRRRRASRSTPCSAPT
jgi:Zn-dependent M32 family carboxypeptidase